MTDKARRERLAAVRAVAPLTVPTKDDALGMAWWNALNDRQRQRWMQIAGNTGRAKDTWEAFKRGDSEDLPTVSRASHAS